MGRLPKVDTLGLLKEVVYDFYEDGKVLEEPKFVRLNPNMDQERQLILRDLTELMMKTDFFNEEVKIYISGYLINFNGVVDALELKHNKEFNVNTVRSKIGYMKTKFEKTFGTDMLKDLLIYFNEDVETYKLKVRGELDKSKGIKLADFIDLDLETDNKNETSDDFDITDDEFDEFLEAIAPYTVKAKEIVSQTIGDEVKGYFNFLCRNSDLSEKDMERLNELKKLLGYE